MRNSNSDNHGLLRKQNILVKIVANCQVSCMLSTQLQSIMVVFDCQDSFRLTRELLSRLLQAIRFVFNLKTVFNWKHKFLKESYQRVSGRCQLVLGMCKMVSGRYQTMSGRCQMVAGRCQMVTGRCQMVSER